MDNIADKWLAVLNKSDDIVICQSPDRCFSLVQLRLQIANLQEAIAKRACKKWILYEPDGFHFLCALFALLTSGREVLVPASENQVTAESLLTRETALIGHHPVLRSRADIEIPRDVQVARPHADTDVTRSGEWGDVVFFTSGSSGQPKQVTKRVDQLFLEAKAFSEKWPLTQNVLFVPLVTHHHMYGLIFILLLPLLAGAGFYLPRNRGLLGVVESIKPGPEQKIDELVIIASPTVGRQAEQISVLAEPGCVARDDRPAPVSRILCAGGRLSETSARKMIRLFNCSITEVFGSTETGAVATREHDKQQKDHWGSWQLLPGLESRVMKDRYGDEVESETQGEFSVWGGHVGGSKENPVTTGDEVKFVASNRFEILGRSNQICKIEGKRVSLSSFVEILEKYELVNEAVVLPFQKNNKEILLCGVVLSEQGKSCYQKTGKFTTDQLIRKHLRQFLDPVLVPRTIRYLDQSPRNAMGKISYRTLGKLLIDPRFPVLPLIDEGKVDRDEVILFLSIPMELEFFRGHFDNRPIVPGVVLLHWAYHFIEEYWKLPAIFSIINRLKFSKPILPGEKLTFILKRTISGVEFLYRSDQENKLASGQILVKAGVPDV